MRDSMQVLRAHKAAGKEESCSKKSKKYGRNITNQMYKST